jgi:hypothetical protein
MVPGGWGRLCPNGKRRKRKKIGGRSHASPRHSRLSFQWPFCLGRSTAPSYRQRRGSRSIHIGARIHFALIALRALLLPAAEHLAAGRGGSATAARAGCQLHSGHHQRPIGNAHSRGVPVSAVCAGKRSIASAGMSICGIPGPTRMQSGTARAWSHGNSGPHRAITRGFCGACKHDAAAKAVGGCGRAPKLITVSHCFWCGANTGIHSGLRYSIIGAYQTSK